MPIAYPGGRLNRSSFLPSTLFIFRVWAVLTENYWEWDTTDVVNWSTGRYRKYDVDGRLYEALSGILQELWSGSGIPQELWSGWRDTTGSISCSDGYYRKVLLLPLIYINNVTNKLHITFWLFTDGDGTCSFWFCRRFPRAAKTFWSFYEGTEEVIVVHLCCRCTSISDMNASWSYTFIDLRSSHWRFECAIM